jgi:outer membrane receptor protein involved in Fe transport
LPQDFRKLNGLLKYSWESDGDRFGLSAQAYDGRWLATDQIPLRSLAQGDIVRFGFIDPTNGGETHRYSLAGEWSGARGDYDLYASLFAVDYRLDLFSNFTYFMDAANGDQFEQFDERRIFGGEFGLRREFDWLGSMQSLKAGAQWRRDDIEKVGLYLTTARRRHDTVREDAVVQSSYSAFASVDLKLSDKVRASVGARADRYDFDVTGDNELNSGSADDSLLSPKLAMVFGPWSKTELFLNVGLGFHSNDARGTTIAVDPIDDVTPVDRVDPLVRALGYDVGVRTALLSNTQVSVALFMLELDSELVYIGDAGATEASGASKRRGVEVGFIVNPVKWLILDADGAYSRARFDNGDRIPNAVETVLSMGVIVNHPSGFNGGLRFRHFGSAPLIEDNSVRSSATTVVNVEAGYASRNGWKATLGLYNVADSDDNDITYFYESQLATEATPIEDIHFHPVEPRTIRASLTVSF